MRSVGIGIDNFFMESELCGMGFRIDKIELTPKMSAVLMRLYDVILYNVVVLGPYLFRYLV